jgi:hypothetical protein
MAIDLDDALVLNILLSVKQGPNLLPNVEYVKATPYATAIQNPANEARGRGFFARIAESSYKRAQDNLNAADTSAVRNDAAALTSSIERLTSAPNEDPWDGSGLHPPVGSLRQWIDKIKPVQPA